MSCIKKNAKFEVLRQNETSEGFLDINAVISIADLVMEYWDWETGKINKEFIPLEELIKAAPTAEKLLLTDLHPFEFVNSKNAKEYQRGFVYKVNGVIDNKLNVDVRVLDSELINDIRSGNKKELSVGYECGIINEPGIIDGQHYDSKQVNLVFNHVSAVPKGRAGEEASFKLNSGERISTRKGSYDAEKINNTLEYKVKYKEENMAVKYNGKDYEPNELVVELMSRDKELKEKSNSLDELNGKYAGLEADNKSLTEKVNNFDSTLEKAVEEKINTVAEVAALTGKETKDLVKMNSIDLKKEVINKAYEGMDLEGKTEGFIDGLFTGAINKLNSSKDPKATPGEEGKTISSNQKYNSEDILRKAMEKSLNGGK